MNSKLQPNQVSNKIVDRANIYKLFADCFKYPQDVMQETLQLLHSTLNNYDDIFVNGAKKMVDSFKVTSLQKLQIEYSRLFVGPFQLGAPPYSSVYLDKQGLVMGESTQQAVEFYVKAGLDPAREIYEPPDHIRIELEFMYFLLFKKVMNEENQWQDLSCEFMEKHISHWAFAFTKKLTDRTENKFYSELSNLLELFLSREIEFFEKSWTVPPKNSIRRKNLVI